jgi:septation ring formation regulator EzrA
VECITIQAKSLGVDVGSKLTAMEKSIESIREGVKTFTEEAFSKDNASLATQSKDSISLGSQRAECIDMRKEESMFSDYFFYPVEKEMPTIRIF